MATRQYSATVSVLLRPLWFNRAPTGRIGINGSSEEFILDRERWFEYKANGEKDTNIILEVEHHSKTNQDSDLNNNRDTAIVIDQIILNGISNPKFAWKGVYTPDYPQHYRDQNPDLPKSMEHYTYLGWNGIWALDLTLPIYTWIHKVEDLGWIYD